MSTEQTRQPMDPAVVDKLLDRLSSDDEYRELFAKDPRAALEQVGHKAPSDDAMACARTETLASKEEIAQARKLLADHLTDQAAMAMTVIFNFEAGRIRTKLSKS